MTARFAGHGGQYFLYSFMGISALLMIPVTLLIMVHYCRNRATFRSGWKSGFAYLIISVIFYLNSCGRMFNECFGSIDNDWIFVGTTYSLYGIHFSLLVWLLFRRLYVVFLKSQYHLHKRTVVCFVALFIFIICDVGTFVFMVYIANITSGGAQVWINALYVAGLLGMIVMSSWLSFLYSYKLFKLIRSHSRHQPTASTRNLMQQNEALVANVSRYTLCAVLWISTGIVFWVSPVIAYYGLVDYLWYLVLYYAFMLLDVSSNTIAFVLGYTFADSVYTALCSHIDEYLRLFIAALVQFKCHCRCRYQIGTEPKERRETKPERSGKTRDEDMLSGHIKDQNGYSTNTDIPKLNGQGQSESVLPRPPQLRDDDDALPQQCTADLEVSTHSTVSVMSSTSPRFTSTLTSPRLTGQLMVPTNSVASTSTLRSNHSAPRFTNTLTTPRLAGQLAVPTNSVASTLYSQSNQPSPRLTSTLTTPRFTGQLQIPAGSSVFAPPRLGLDMDGASSMVSEYSVTENISASENTVVMTVLGDLYHADTVPVDVTPSPRDPGGDIHSEDPQSSDPNQSDDAAASDVNASDVNASDANASDVNVSDANLSE